MAHFAVRLVHGPGWDSARPIREQDGWDEHAAFMDGLVDDGFIILGGPVGNGEQTLHVVEAAGEQDVETRLARDPWASARLLKIGVIEPWALWLDSRVSTRARRSRLFFPLPPPPSEPGRTRLSSCARPAPADSPGAPLGP